MFNLSNKPSAQTGSTVIVHPQSRVRVALRSLITSQGHVIFEAADLSTASSLFLQEDIQVVLCDKDAFGPGELTTERKRALFPYADILSLPLTDAISGDPRILLSAISHTLEKVQLEKRVRQLEEYIEPDTDFSIGESSVIRDLVAMIKRTAPLDGAVLLQGESGTGKQLFARALHTGSHRKNNPFIILHCKMLTGISPELELFGCKGGAYPGISKDRTGALEKAYKGSLVLVDVDHLPLPVQVRLIEALTSQSYIKPGDTSATSLNVRIFSTTQKDLCQEIEAGRFEESLFHRLNTFYLHVPSLRERKMDIPLLTRHFTKQFAQNTDKKIKEINKEFLYHLQRYDWKGNIRELRNIIERAVIMTESHQLTEENLPFEIRYFQDGALDLAAAFDLKTQEKRHLQKVLTYTRGNKVEAARLLNIGLATLYRKISE